VILLSINQAQFVPQENREVEFQHFQDVQDDMVDVRSAISTAGQTNVSQYPTVRLGTNYPTRLFAVNPPPPTGTLRTSQSYNISIYEPGNPDPQNVSTQFLEYQNGYNELDVGSIWYENSVLYLDETSNDGNIAVIEDQNLLTGNNDPVRITALQKNYSQSSTNRVAIEFYPAENPDIDIDELEGPVTITIPTRLNKTYWNSELGGYSAYNQNEFETNPNNVNFLQLTVNLDSLAFNTVGINSNPDDETSAKRGTGDTKTPTKLPDGAVAFLDANEDGIYQASEESYTVRELEDLSVDGNIRVIRDAVMNDGSLDGISIDATNITIEPDIEMSTTGGGQTIDLISEETIDISSSSIQSVAPITIDAGNQLIAEAADIQTTGGGGDINLNSGSSMNIASTSVQSIAPIAIDAGEEINSDNANIVATGGGSDITFESGSDISVSNANIEAINIEFDSSGFIDLDGTGLAAASSGSLSADLTGNADLFVEDASFTSGGDPADLEYGPGNSVNVIGEPSTGGTTS